MTDIGETSIKMDELAPFLWNVSSLERPAPKPLRVENSTVFTKLPDVLPLATPDNPLALVTEHPDKPGEIERVVSILAGWGVNVAGAAVRRNRSGGRALLITLVDDDIPDGAMKTLRELTLKPELWNCGELDGLDLTGFPLGSNEQGAAVVTHAPDRPGEIAKAARALAHSGLNSTGFLVYRKPERPTGETTRDTLQVNLLEKDPREEPEKAEYKPLVTLCRGGSLSSCITSLVPDERERGRRAERGARQRGRSTTRRPRARPERGRVRHAPRGRRTRASG